MRKHEVVYLVCGEAGGGGLVVVPALIQPGFQAALQVGVERALDPPHAGIGDVQAAGQQRRVHRRPQAPGHHRLDARGSHLGPGPVALPGQRRGKILADSTACGREDGIDRTSQKGGAPRRLLCLGYGRQRSRGNDTQGGKRLPQPDTAGRQ